MTREQLIQAWWPFIEHTIFEGVRLYLAGDEPKKFCRPEMLYDEVPHVVKLACCQIYNDVMAKVVHREVMSQDELYVTGPNAFKKFSRDMQLEEMREKISLPKGVVPNGIRRGS